MSWTEENKIPVGEWGKGLHELFGDGGAVVFGTSANFLTELLLSVEWGLSSVPPLVVIAVISVLVWVVRRSFALAAFAVIAQLFVLNQGYMAAFTQTLSLAATALFFSALVGIPVGFALSRFFKTSDFLFGVTRVHQTLLIPVYLIVSVIFFGFGPASGLVATTLILLPMVALATHSAFGQTQKELVETGRAFGASSSQMFWKVELPAAKAKLIEGIQNILMFAFFAAVLAAFVGARGLGVPFVDAMLIGNVAVGIEAGLVLLALSVLLAAALFGKVRT